MLFRSAAPAAKPSASADIGAPDAGGCARSSDRSLLHSRHELPAPKRGSHALNPFPILPIYASAAAASASSVSCIEAAMKHSRPGSRGSEAPSSAAPNTPEAHAHNPDSPSDDARLYSRGTGKRNRVHFSCTECYRRKQKCNRETPCQHCIARKIPERCKTFQPGEDANDVATRLNRVERMLEDHLPKLAEQVHHLVSLLGSSTTSRPQPHDPHPRIPSASRSTWHEGALARSPERTYARASDQGDDDIDELETGRYSPKTGFYSGGSMDMRISSILDDLPGSSSKSAPLNPPVRTLEGPSEIDVVMPEYGCPTAPTPDLLGAFSTRAHCSVLIDHFFNDINWMRQPFPQKSLRKSFEAFWDSGPKINAQNINIFALLCNICAIAMLSVQHRLFPEGPRDRLKAARRYHYAGRRALLMSTIMGREDVDQIVAWLVSCRFLLLDRRIGEAYTLGSSAVRAAFSIGLHRDGTKLGLSPAETEARRRVWAAVYFLDRAMALNTGRPAVIDDRVCDTQVPSEVMDEDIFPAPKHPPKMPPGVDPPTAYSYTVFRQRIAELEGRILATFQNLQHPVHISDVLALDKSMRELQDGLPFYFRAKLTKDGVEGDKSLDSVYGFLNVHRFLLHTEINSVRIALHRPYLLRSGGPNGAKFLPCREASLDAAVHDLEMRRDFVQNLKTLTPAGEEPLLYRVQIGTYKWFHSLLVVGIVLLMDPNARDAPKLKSHLEEYVNTYKSRPASQRDEMRDREANVIGIFLSRIEQVEKMAAEAKGNASGSRAAPRAPKRGRSTDAGPNSDARDRLNKSRKRGKDAGDELSDEKSDAHLLLSLDASRSGLNGAGRREVGNEADAASKSYLDRLARGAVPSTSDAPQDAGSTASRQGSGDWSFGGPRGLSGTVDPSSSASSSNSPSTSSLPAVMASGHGVNDPKANASSSSTPTWAPAPNGGGEDAQQFFDAWYQAEWAAATMPSYDAAYNGANGLGGGAAGVSLGLDSLAGFSGVFGSTSNGGGASSGPVSQGLGGGFNGLIGPSIGAPGAAAPGPGANGSKALAGAGTGAGLTTGGGMSEWMSQAGGLPPSYAATTTSAATSDRLADLLSRSQPASNTDGSWQEQRHGAGQSVSGSSGLQPPGAVAASAFGSSAPTGASGSQAQGSQALLTFDGSAPGLDGHQGAGAGQRDFDPAFWQTLIANAH
ncbi:uncharacterized protein PAN0_013c4802 [Moesziomyces antarcticus]|uniref:Zn(2)-C6 fungal-type domain-containing protein n=1 Tax=Pseudozyma antarctica TaxID=84753 RepID=A0A081CIT3_PSEA2|nr:uncharacterized protein PAN0_013c4802 [Moesziomyces antarcticus]GAK66579.1 conserved hypothetical protein [Moesziomyces antarcticus]